MPSIIDEENQIKRPIGKAGRREGFAATVRALNGLVWRSMAVREVEAASTDFVFIFPPNRFVIK